jgi:alpha-methylacyl-CoA racemase
LAYHGNENKLLSMPLKTKFSSGLRPLRKVRILSIALNLPGPAALMRCRDMGARCTKFEPPAPKDLYAGDPMNNYCPQAYAHMHEGITVVHADLKSEAGQKALHKVLAKTDVLLTSFRPSALARLGLGWKQLKRQYPHLSMVEIVGSPAPRSEEPGHDLTYLAETGLVTGLDLPPSLYADMGGSLIASEAVLKARLLQLEKGHGVRFEVALSEAAEYLGLPRQWGLTLPGSVIGGSHAGYRVYACKNGRVALAALEPHFASRLATEIGLKAFGTDTMTQPSTLRMVAKYMAGKTCQQLDAMAREKDIPLYTMPL